MAQQQAGRFDDMYLTICQETGGLDGLLDSMFSFMYRKTDFFYEADPGDKMGFPPGQNVNILIKQFKKYQDEHYKTKQPKKDPKEFQAKLEQYKLKTQQAQQALQQQEIKQQQEKFQKEQQEKQKQTSEQKEKKDQKQEIKKEEQTQQQQKQQQQSTKPIIQDTEQSDFNTYNGGKTDKYSWSQNITEVTVEILLKQQTKAKQLQVNLQNTNIDIQFQGETILKGELYHPIKVDDSIWSIEDGTKLILTLEKADEHIWKTVLKGDKEIDATKVDNKKDLSTFDGETQSAIRKMMYDQQRKQMGLPTSEEENQQEMLRKAWDAEGSPFKGQPFDPSKLNLPSGALQQQ